MGPDPARTYADDCEGPGDWTIGGLISVHADRRRHTGLLSGLRKSHLKVKRSGSAKTWGRNLYNVLPSRRRITKKKEKYV